MSNRMTVNYDNKPSYDIVFETSFDMLKEELEKHNIHNRKVCIVTESIVGPLYAVQIKNILDSCAKEVILFEFPAGEQSKNLDIVKELYEKLIISHFDRKDLLIALGGGVVGDLTGFTAATYLRGIDFIQIPTTLLSQVDSSIGGKTGVDFNNYKNMVGAFHQPKLVYINLSVLHSMNKREYLSGMGEVIKYGIIFDNAFFDWLIDNKDFIINQDIDIMKEMVKISCDCKRIIVEKDPKEQGDRALLNMGHTIGHSVEKLMNFELLHGECVSIGMVAAAYISYQKGYIDEESFIRIRSTLKYFELPVNIPALDSKEVADATMNDKKMTAGIIKFILIDRIGHGIIDTSVTMNDMINAVDNN